MDIHTATAGTYLEELNEIGLLEKREGQGETRKVLEYRLRDPKIDLSCDISEMFKTDKEEGQDDQLYVSLLESFIDETKTIYGYIPEKVAKEESLSSKKEESILDSIRELLKYNEEKMGLRPTQRLVRRVGINIEERFPMKENYRQFINKLPKRYFELLKEELDEQV